MSCELEIKYKGKTVVRPGYYGYIPRTTFPPGALRCLVNRVDIDSVYLNGLTCKVEFCGGTDASLDGEEATVSSGDIYPTEREAFEASMALQLEEIDKDINHIAETLKSRQLMREEILKVGASYGK